MSLGQRRKPQGWSEVSGTVFSYQPCPQTPFQFFHGDKVTVSPQIINSKLICARSCVGSWVVSSQAVTLAQCTRFQGLFIRGALTNGILGYTCFVVFLGVVFFLFAFWLVSMSIFCLNQKDRMVVPVTREPSFYGVE